MNDEDFVSYCSFHACTEIALFHREHVERIFALAHMIDLWRQFDDEPARSWFTVHENVMSILVKRARERIAAR